MVRATATDNEQTYVQSLRWRRGDLQEKIGVAHERLQALTRQEADLRQELQAVQQLLFAADGGGDSGSGVDAPDAPTEDSETNGHPGSAALDEPAFDLTGYGPTARKIYATSEQVIREAGVPLHYRVLAVEVQKKAPLSGKDPGATLIAHLNRAQELFPRVGRGVYAIRGMVDPEQTSESMKTSKKSSTKPRRTRRRRVR